MSDAPAEAPSPYRRGEEAASADAAPAYPAPGRCPPATGRKSSVLPPAPPSAPCSHICNYGWEWDKCPNWVLTDCAGLGWNHDFHPDDAVDSDYNKTFKTYVNQGNASDKKYTTKHIYEKELQTAEDQFDMNGFYGSDYYVKSGSGTICLSQTGKVNDVKLSFKYGHNQFGPAVSVSYPWGVSFGLDGAETIFQPDEIVYNDFATVK